MDRRNFIGAAGTAAALFGAPPANAALLASGTPSGRTVADWGVEANSERDQSQTLQKAIDESARAGQPVIIPAGQYRCSRLQLSSRSQIFGTPGLTVLMSQPDLPVFECSKKSGIGLHGLTFVGTGLLAVDCASVTITGCDVTSSSGDGFFCTGTSLYVAGNRCAACTKSAIWIAGDGMVTNNLIGGNGQFGLRLGISTRLGTLTAVNNRIAGAAVGIGISNAGDGYALVAMNMITGARSGGVRALNGEELVGKDLTQGGSEAFRNLAVAANVSL